MFTRESLEAAIKEIEKLGPLPSGNPWQDFAKSMGFDLDAGDICVVSESGMALLRAVRPEPFVVPLHKNVHLSKYATEPITFIRKPEPPEIFAGIDPAGPGEERTVLSIMGRYGESYGVVHRRKAMGWIEFLSKYPIVRRENFWSCEGVGASRSPKVVYALRQQKYIDINRGAEYPSVVMMGLMSA